MTKDKKEKPWEFSPRDDLWTIGKINGPYSLRCGFCDRIINRGDTFVFKGPETKCLKCHSS